METPLETFDGPIAPEVEMVVLPTWETPAEEETASPRAGQDTLVEAAAPASGLPRSTHDGVPGAYSVRSAITHLPSLDHQTSPATP